MGDAGRDDRVERGQIFSGLLVASKQKVFTPESNGSNKCCPYVLGSAAARTWVTSPEAIKALTSSKLGVQFQACPAFQALAKQPRTLANAAQGNASAAAVVNDPNFRAELERLEIRQDMRPQRTFKKAAR